MELLTLKESRYENISVGGSIERRFADKPVELSSPARQAAIESGFKAHWEIEELILGKRGDEIVLLGDEVKVIGHSIVPAEKLDVLAYGGLFTVNGRVVAGRRIIISHLCKDLCDVLVLN